MGIKLLDCTLRDGGHQNNSKFGESVIKDIVAGLEMAGTDYIEIGFLREQNIGIDYAASNSLIDFENRICTNDNNGKTEYTVMIQQDQYGVEKLLKYSGGKIKNIRISFHDYDCIEGLSYCREVIQKGYKVFVNPINIMGYSDSKILKIIKSVNEMGADYFTIVDTFGSMTKNALLRLFMLVENNLNSNIGIGIHLHDNLQMSYSLAQTVIEISSNERNIVIDGSLLGMGREPGNLCIELIMQYINKKIGFCYDVDYALDLIDTYITKLKQKFPWGYEIAYSLSAQFNLHRSYAEYLMKKQKLKTKQIRQILGMIEQNKKTRYDKDYIEKLYYKFISAEIDDSLFRNQLIEEIGNKEVLLIAPGHSLCLHKEVINKFYKDNNVFVVSANFIPKIVEVDYIFCSNKKRFDNIKGNILSQKIILAPYLSEKEFTNYINTNELGWFGKIFWDNCMLMLLNLVKKMGIKKCYIAGWDGFSDEDNFVDESMESVYYYKNENIKVIEILNNYFLDINIEFITPSIYCSER